MPVFEENLKDFAHRAQYHTDEGTGVEELSQNIEKLSQCAPDIRAWCQWQKSKNELIAEGIPEVVSALEQNLISPESVKEDLLTAFVTGYLDHLWIVTMHFGISVQQGMIN